MPRFDREGIGFRYLDAGEGPAVVFCHGLGGNLDQPKDLLGNLLDCRIILWDARGHGETNPTGPTNAFSFREFAADLAALLRHLRVARAIVGGISMGAGVAVRFALNEPDLARALVLVRPAWLVHPMPENLKLLPVIARLLSNLGPEKGRQAFARRPEFRAVSRTAPAVAESYLQQFAAPFARERRARLERLPMDCPARDWSEANSLEIPTLVVGNDRDPVHPLAYARAWARHLPDARLAQIPSKSENPEAHTRSFRKHFENFLKELKG